MKKKLFWGLSVFGVISISAVTFFITQTESLRSPASMPENYEHLTGCEKQEILWQKSLATIHQELPPFSKFGAVQLLQMSFQELAVKGELHSDFAPEGWKKYLHHRGALAKVKVVSTSDKYTGIFQGADCGLLRLSLTYHPNGSRPVAPGLAFKVLRGDAPSANISALVSLEGQDRDFNFFKHPMSNIVPASQKFGQKLVHRVFSKVSAYPEELVVRDMAEINSHGEKEKTVQTPRQLFFVPKTLVFSSEKHDVREDFLAIPEGTTLYQVFALTQKYDDFNYDNYTPADVAKFLKESVHVADIVTSSEFVASEFGDSGIFFRHQIRPK